MILAKNIKKSFGDVHVLQDVSFSIASGEIVAITGKSGAGKSTLLHILGTLERPDQGFISLDGQEILKLKSNALADFRNKKIGFIFQFHHLLPEFNALENVCLAAYIQGISKSKAETKAKELLNYLGLSHRITHKPKEMSGGEQQRVAFARALINDPTIVLADEPTGNLDEKTANELHEMIFKLREETGRTFVIVTHNTPFAQVCDRRIVMDAGLIVDQVLVD